MEDNAAMVRSLCATCSVIKVALFSIQPQQETIEVSVEDEYVFMVLHDYCVYALVSLSCFIRAMMHFLL